MDIPIALTVAGSDSSGGAGIQADLRTFGRLKVYGLSVVTSITAQNTSGIFGTFDVPSEFVTTQLDAIFSDASPSAMKTGMLASAASVHAVAAAIQRYGIQRVIVDPVLASTSGTPLLASDAVAALRKILIPLAALITPNLPEAQALTGQAVVDLPSMERAARDLHDMGAQTVLVKGGHLAGAAIDLFFDGREVALLPAERLPNSNVHGTGCILSAAITGYLALGNSTDRSVRLGKEFITDAIRNAVSIGRGSPVLL